MKRLFVTLVLTSCLALVTENAAAQAGVEFNNPFPGIEFNRPIDFTHDESGRLYIAEQKGKLFTMRNQGSESNPQLFLDLSDRISEDVGTHAGLLSIAFHPNYEENDYFYVYYVTDEPTSAGVDTVHSVLSRFERSPTDSTRADPESEQILLEIPQPTVSHNGGDVAFGPEGYLYLSIGEGSHGADKYDQAQDRTTLLGTVVRIDVDEQSGERSYGIPEDNPYVDNSRGFREEIFAYGLRNPWRLSVDQETAHVWVGDVGENSWEEVNVIEKGGNYGWPIVEGNECFQSDDCDKSQYVAPVFTYPHPGDDGRCVTGGFVYRGSRIPELQGKYIFGDWVTMELWSIDFEAGVDTVVTSIPIESRKSKHYPSFGQDSQGELYYLSIFHGMVHKFAPAEPETPEEPDEPGEGEEGTATETTLELSGPNPAAGPTSVTFKTVEGGPVRIAVYDILGRRVSVLYDDVVPAGTIQPITVHTETLPAGTYFLRMAMPGFQQTQKILLVE